MARVRDPILLGALIAIATGCTTFNDLVAGASGGDCGNACPGNGSGAAGVNAACRTGADCSTGVCTTEGTCAPATTTDAVKNGRETDVDCGGGEAPKCEAGKACKEGTDCFWGYCTGGVCEGHQPGRKDGDQTDVDCGGTVSPACDWGQGCLEDRDCTSKVCGLEKTCLVGPSCRTLHGGSTCGVGEFTEGGKQHESCCKTLPVTGFSGAPAGKTVYLDKYEITAGRMRTFLDAVAAAQGGSPDVKAFMAARRPARWLAAWEAILPSSNANGTASYTITNPTVDLAYPGPDKFRVNNTQPSWSLNTGNYSVLTGLFFVLGSAHLFPEYSAPTDPTDYPATHNLNCGNESDSYGYGTYWFDAQTVAQYSGGVGKKFTKDEMDEKALNCTPFGLFVAFCAWDGGQLATSQVFDYVAGGPWPVSDVGVPLSSGPPPRLAKGAMNCGGDNSIVTFSDGTSSCPAVYYYPNDEGVTFDGSARIAPPGRVPGDTVRLNPGDEPWMDLIGNLQEAVLLSNDTFGTRGYGAGWGSSVHHRNQQTTPRFKAGGVGARCMRVK
jgi:hypothetical protein